MTPCSIPKVCCLYPSIFSQLNKVLLVFEEKLGKYTGDVVRDGYPKSGVLHYGINIYNRFQLVTRTYILCRILHWYYAIFYMYKIASQL